MRIATNNPDTNKTTQQQNITQKTQKTQKTGPNLHSHTSQTW